MEQDHDFQSGSAARRTLSLRPALIGIAGAFVVGVGATLYLTGGSDLGLSDVFSLRSEGDRASSQPVDSAPTSGPSAAASAAAVEALEAAERAEQVVEQAGGLDSRVAAMEQRMTRLDIQAQSAAGNAARAEGLLIAFASRRQIERGEPLGYLAEQLRLRFGDARPNAVLVVIEAAEHPVTLDRLMARLEGIAPELDDAPEGEGVFTRIGRELSSLFVVRREETPSPVAERRLERARLFLESGRIQAAVAEVQAMPNAAIAEEWIADASRYAAAQQALETLETAAVLDPRELRDSGGEQVRQRSPAQAGQ